jgi:mono/diheme cytochrome c family protein
MVRSKEPVIEVHLHTRGDLRRARARAAGRASRPVPAAVCAAALAALASDARGQTPPVNPTPRSVRITMDTLHQLGGVPPGWTLSPPSGDPARGRAAFEQLGCHTCHAVRGESFAAPIAPGPELTGMGGHHPAAYFVESILNPSAVVVDGPGYVGADGRSTMPAYPEMTVAQLADVVAYLGSLRSGEMNRLTPPTLGLPPSDTDLPAPPPSGARRYMVQVYDVKPGRLAEFEQWFRTEGKAEFLAEPGVAAIDTIVDRTRSGPRLVTVLTFDDDAAFLRFTTSPGADRVGQRFDDFIGPHGHDVHTTPPIYRSETLSARRTLGAPDVR